MDFTYEDHQGTINLDFTGFDATSTPEDTALVYNTTECNVYVALSTLETIIQSIGSEDSGEQNTGLIEDTVEYSAEFDTHFTFDTSAAKLVEKDGGVDFADGEIIINGDGSLDLTDGENSLHINIGGLSALKEELLEAEGVSIEVIEGQVPLGSEASYEAHTEAKTQALVEQYIAEASEEEDVAGYTAADLKIIRNGEDIGAEGLFQVTVDKESLVPAGMKLEKLYHIHDGIVDPLEVNETEEGYVFQVENFSDIIVSYTVDFEYNGYKWSFLGLGSYAIADIMSEIGVEGEIGSVSLECVEGEQIPEALYLEEKTDGWYLTSDCAFDETYELRVIVEGSAYVIIVTDAPAITKVTLSFFGEDGETPDSSPDMGNGTFYLAIVDGNNIKYKTELQSLSTTLELTTADFGNIEASGYAIIKYTGNDIESDIQYWNNWDSSAHGISKTTNGSFCGYTFSETV